MRQEYYIKNNHHFPKGKNDKFGGHKRRKAMKFGDPRNKSLNYLSKSDFIES